MHASVSEPSPAGSLNGRPEVEPTFDDSSWSSVDIPHDFLIGGEYSPKGDKLEGMSTARRWLVPQKLLFANSILGQEDSVSHLRRRLAAHHGVSEWTAA